jgi:hypothetical protein
MPRRPSREKNLCSNRPPQVEIDEEKRSAVARHGYARLATGCRLPSPHSIALVTNITEDCDARLAKSTLVEVPECLDLLGVFVPQHRYARTFRPRRGGGNPGEEGDTQFPAISSVSRTFAVP